MAKISKCRDCRTLLPLDCPFFRFQLPPEEVICTGCGKLIPTTFTHRNIWMGQQVFRLAWFTCTLAIFVSCFLHGTTLLASAVLAVVGGLFIGGVCGSLAGSLLAPLLVGILGTAKKLQGTKQRNAVPSHDELRLRQYINTGRKTPPLDGAAESAAGLEAVEVDFESPDDTPLH